MKPRTRTYGPGWDGTSRTEHYVWLDRAGQSTTWSGTRWAMIPLQVRRALVPVLPIPNTNHGKRLVKVVLTVTEARELLGVAGNGYMDGDYYQLNNEGHPPTAEQKAANEVYSRAESKLRAATNGTAP